jgi:hypothetical protein
MEDLMRKLLILSFISLVMTPSFARKPAVDPVIGVSIEEYKEVPPEKAQGFDFNRKPNSKNIAAPVARTHSPEKLSVQNATDANASSGKLLFLFFIFLPIIASGITFYRLSKRHRDIHGMENLEVTERDEERNDDDFDIPKAS